MFTVIAKGGFPAVPEPAAAAGGLPFQSELDPNPTGLLDVDDIFYLFNAKSR
jgi:hypothetical protein